jgi:hypothetical protein
MSRHHIVPTALYTPPPKKIEKKKPRIGASMLSEFDEMEEAREADATRPSAPVTNSLVQQNFPEIEDASRKPQHPPGLLSRDTLSVLLRAQELK